jgi:hypothetical protein
MKNLKTQGLPSWSKGVIAVAVTGAAVFIGYKIYKLISDKQSAEDKQREKDVESSLNKQLVEQGVKLNPTYKANQYISYANSIFGELNGFGAGSALVIEKALMAMKNDLDVLNLIKAYGTRQRTVFGIDKAGKQDLMSSLATEWASLNDSSKKKINNDWANKNIKYRIA